MSYWIICLPREDMLHCLRIGTFGLGRRQTICNVEKGDKVVCIVTREKEWKIVGIGDVVSDYYVDDKSIFQKEGIFPDRFDFMAEPLKREVPFSALVGTMSFITKPEYWNVYFRTGIVKISSSDWNSLERAVSAAAV